MSLAPDLDRPGLDRDLMLRLFELADIIIPFAIGVAADLRIADRLVEGPRTADELAAESRTHPEALYRLLRALASKEIFREEPTGTFALTPMADLLRSKHPLSLRRLFLTVDADVAAFAHIGYSVRTGEPAFDHVHGEEFWSYLATRPEASQQFDELMAGFTALEAQALLPAYRWGELGTVADIGGGNGALLAAILAGHPGMRGILFDLPAVVAGAGPVLAEAGVADRCEVIGGSFRDTVPPGADAYLLKRIIYNYPDDDAVHILRTVRRAVPTGGRVLLLEPVYRRGNLFEMGRLMDLKMLVLGHGRVRTRAELRDLLAEAGFRLAHLIPTPMVAVIEGRPL
jgi:hypothetical protein